MAAAEQADRVAPILCTDCSYKSGREYWHAQPECAGARLPKEVPAPPKVKRTKKTASWPRLKGWQKRLEDE